MTKQTLWTTRRIRVDDQQFDGDSDMEYIVRRLQSAAADPEVRYQMNAEDEFFKEIENRDTAIMERDAKLKEQSTQLKEQSEMLKNMVEGMLLKGISVKEIARMTGLSEEKIQKLQ